MDINKEKIMNEDKEVLNALGKEEEFISLSKEQILAIHDSNIEKFGGIFGIRDEGLLNSICSSPYQSIFGTDLYPTIFDKAAKYLFDFAHYQVFLDGNKRTGWATCRLFLRANGYTLNLSDIDKYNLVMAIANNKITEVNDISHILKENAQIKIGKSVIKEDKSYDELER